MNPLQKIFNAYQNKQQQKIIQQSGVTPQQQNIWAQKLDEIKSGKADPKTVATEMVSRLSPQQKVFLKNMLPRFQNFARKYGAPDTAIGSFMTEVKNLLN